MGVLEQDEHSIHRIHDVHYDTVYTMNIMTR